MKRKLCKGAEKCRFVTCVQNVPSFTVDFGSFEVQAAQTTTFTGPQRYDAVQSGKNVQTFRKKLQASYSGLMPYFHQNFPLMSTYS
jgi:hypothetical protein